MPLWQRLEQNYPPEPLGAKQPGLSSVLNLEYPQALTTVTFPVEMARDVIHTLWISLWTTLEEAHHE